MLVQVCDINTGKAKISQQISDDAGQYQCEQLAYRLIDEIEDHPEFCYWSASQHGQAIHKGCKVGYYTAVGECGNNYYAYRM